MIIIPVMSSGAVTRAIFKMQDGDGTKVTDVLAGFAQHVAAKVTVVEDRDDDMDRDRLREELAELRKIPSVMVAFITRNEVGVMYEFEVMRIELKLLFKRKSMEGGGIGGG